MVSAILEELRVADSPQSLRQEDAKRDGEWAHGVAARPGLGEDHRDDVRRIEDAATACIGSRSHTGCAST